LRQRCGVKKRTTCCFSRGAEAGSITKELVMRCAPCASRKKVCRTLAAPTDALSNAIIRGSATNWSTASAFSLTVAAFFDVSASAAFSVTTIVRRSPGGAKSTGRNFWTLLTGLAGCSTSMSVRRDSGRLELEHYAHHTAHGSGVTAIGWRSRANDLLFLDRCRDTLLDHFRYFKQQKVARTSAELGRRRSVCFGASRGRR
jgi:hypothetical protein